MLENCSVGKMYHMN